MRVYEFAIAASIVLAATVADAAALRNPGKIRRGLTPIPTVQVDSGTCASNSHVRLTQDECKNLSDNYAGDFGDDSHYPSGCFSQYGWSYYNTYPDSKDECSTTYPCLCRDCSGMDSCNNLPIQDVDNGLIPIPTIPGGTVLVDSGTCASNSLVRLTQDQCKDLNGVYYAGDFGDDSHYPSGCFLASNGLSYMYNIYPDSKDECSKTNPCLCREASHATIKVIGSPYGFFVLEYQVYYDPYNCHFEDWMDVTQGDGAVWDTFSFFDYHAGAEYFGLDGFVWEAPFGGLSEECTVIKITAYYQPVDSEILMCDPYEGTKAYTNFAMSYDSNDNYCAVFKLGPSI